jgi:hypothetical protein
MKSWAPPTAEELDRVAVLCARPENRAYFFDRLDNPKWVGPLSKRGFFASPPKPVAAGEPGYIRFPPWPEGRYLARVAGDTPDEVTSVLAGLEVSENPAVTGVLFQAMANLPADRLRSLAAKATEWVRGAFADYFANEAAAVVVRLLSAGGVAPALDLVASLLEVRPDPRLAEKASTADSPVRAHPEPVGRLSQWGYEQVIERVLEPTVDAAGLDGVRLFAGLLEEALRLSRWEDQNGPDNLSEIWLPAIENHEQNSDRGVRNSLVSAVRDAALSFAARGASELKSTISLLEDGSLVQQRIALHVLASIGEGSHLAVQRLADRRLFDDFRVRHEYAALLRARFPELDMRTRNSLISWIEAGPDVDRYRRRRTEAGGAPPSEDDVTRYSDLWRRDRYSFIEPHLEGRTAERYYELVRSLGEPEHPDFVSWMSAGWTGPQSPATRDELLQRSADEVIDYLRRWRPEDDSGWHFGPSMEGLGRVFSEVVAARADEFAHVAGGLGGLDPTYVRHLFLGFEAALRDGTTFRWAGPLDLASLVVARPFEPDAEVPDRDRDPGWRWCRGQIGSFLRSGLSDRQNRVPFELREHLWAVIERLIRDPNPSPEHEARYGGDNMDPLTLSINTNRGTAMHAVVEYALWCRREMESRGQDVSVGFNVMPEVRGVLASHLDAASEPSVAVRAVYGRWLPWLQLLDESWTAQHIPLIFPSGTDGAALADAAWETYITSCPPYNAALRVLRAQYHDAILRIPSNKKAGLFSHENVDSRLGQHVVTFYWRDVLDRELVEEYFARADDGLAADLIGFVGRALQNTVGEVPDAISHRMQELWEWRFSTCHENPDAHELELRAFGTWFASSKFDAAWALDALERAVDLVGAPISSHLVAERLVDVSEREPLTTARIFARMIERPENEWDYIGMRDEAKAIVAAAHATRDPDAAEHTATIVDFYVRHGELDFRDLFRDRTPR